MRFGRLSLRLGVLLTAALPPALALGAFPLAEPTWMDRLGGLLSLRWLGRVL